MKQIQKIIFSNLPLTTMGNTLMLISLSCGNAVCIIALNCFYFILFYFRTFSELKVKHEQLQLITPQFETPLPPLQPAVSQNEIPS